MQTIVPVAFLKERHNNKSELKELRNDILSCFFFGPLKIVVNLKETFK